MKPLSLDALGTATEARAVPAARAVRGALVGLIVFVLALAVYMPAVGAPFIWDDNILIFDSGRVTELRPLKEYLGTAFWGRGDVDPVGRSYYRPLSILSLALDHRLHGDNPGGYHLTNIALHALSALLLFGLIRRRKVGIGTAAVFSLAWAWFPRLTEAAAWVSGRTDVIATFFVLLALTLTPARNIYSRCLAAFCLFLGLLGKEVAAAGLVAILLLEWLSSRGERTSARILRVIPALTVAVIYCVLRVRAIGVAAPLNGFSLAQRIPCAFDALGHYAWMLVDGWHANTQIGFLGEPHWQFMLLGLLVLVGGGVLLIRQRHALDGLSVASLALVCVGIGLVLHVMPINVNIMAADRFLYLPLAGLTMLLAPLADKLVFTRTRPIETSAKTDVVPEKSRVGTQIKSWLERPVLVACGLLVLSYAPVTLARTATWADEVEFWFVAFQQQKDHNANSRLELGNIYARAGMDSEARALYLDATNDDWMNYLLTLNNLALRLTVSGEAREGEGVMRRLVQAAEGVPKFHFTLGLALLAQERFDEAQREAERATQLNPDSKSTKALRDATAEARKLSQRPKPDTSTTPGKLEDASRLAKIYRAREALDELVRAAEEPDMQLSQLLSALLFAFDFGSPRQLTSLYRAYRAHAGSAPEIIENYEMRMERVRRLKSIWPLLAQYQTVPKPGHEGPVRRISRTPLAPVSQPSNE